MDAVHAALLDAVRALLLAEAGGVGGQRLRQALLGDDLVDELADHRMLGGADQIEVLALDFVHHGVHFREAHDAGHHVRTDHERGDHIGEAPVDHKVAGVGNDGGVQARDIAHEIVEPVTGDPAGGVEVDAVKGLHDLGVVGDLEIRDHGLAEAFDLHVLAVVFSDGNGGVDDVRDRHHDGADLFGELGFLLLQFRKTGGLFGDLLLDGLGLFLLTLRHETADLLRELVPVPAELVGLLHDGAVFGVESDHFVDERELFFLEFVADVLAHGFGIFAHEFDVKHGFATS